MDTLKQHLDALYPLPPEDSEAFLTLWACKELPKNFEIIAEGEVSNYLYFVEKGSVRSFFSMDNKEVTEWIALEDTFTFSPTSLFSRQPGRLIFQTVEASVLYAIEVSDLEQISAKSIHVAQLFRVLLANSQIGRAHV